MITPEEALRWSDHLESEADRFSEVVVAALRRAIRAGIDDIPGITAQGDPEAEEVAASLDELSHIESRWRTELDTVLEPEMLEFMRAGATEALRQLAIQAPVVLDSLRHPAAESYLQQSFNRLVGVGDGLWQNVRDKLVAGLQAGDSIPELTAAVQAELAATEIRARTIARTEVIGASNAGAFIQVQALDEAVRPVSKMWLATPDGRTRVTHRAAGGQVAPLDGNFEVGGASMQYPGDPAGPAREVINCRCTIIWIDSEELLDEGIDAATTPRIGENAELIDGDAGSISSAANARLQQLRDGGIDDAGAQAHRRYTRVGSGRQPDYESMNNSLRGLRDMDSDNAETIANLDRLFDSAGVRNTASIQVNRRVTPNSDVNRALGSGEFVDDGYTSVSIADPPSEFGDLRMSITIPPNTPMLAGTRREQELILPRGSRFRVTNRTANEVEMELVP